MANHCSKQTLLSISPLWFQSTPALLKTSVRGTLDRVLYTTGSPAAVQLTLAEVHFDQC